MPGITPGIVFLLCETRSETKGTFSGIKNMSNLELKMNVLKRRSMYKKEISFREEICGGQLEAKNRNRQRTQRKGCCL